MTSSLDNAMEMGELRSGGRYNRTGRPSSGKYAVFTSDPPPGANVAEAMNTSNSRTPRRGRQQSQRRQPNGDTDPVPDDDEDCGFCPCCSPRQFWSALFITTVNGIVAYIIYTLLKTWPKEIELAIVTSGFWGPCSFGFLFVIYLIGCCFFGEENILEFYAKIRNFPTPGPVMSVYNAAVFVPRFIASVPGFIAGNARGWQETAPAPFNYMLQKWFTFYDTPIQPREHGNNNEADSQIQRG